jgi:hypothetical protein
VGVLGKALRWKSTEAREFTTRPSSLRLLLERFGIPAAEGRPREGAQTRRAMEAGDGLGVWRPRMLANAAVGSGPPQAGWPAREAFV